MTGLHRNAKYDDEAIRAAAKVFAEHGRFIRGVIRFHAHDEVHEDDLFQEFFLALVNSPLPSNVRNIRGYLYRAIINDAVDMTRRQEKYQRNLKKHAERTRISINKKTLEDAIEETDEIDCVFARLAKRLQPREAQVMSMRYRQDCSIGEIAAALGVNKRTVSRYLSSALSKIRGAFGIE